MTADISVTRPASKQTRPSNAELAYNGKLFDVWRWHQELYDGSTAIFEGLSRPDTVLVLPVQRDRKVVLIEESQPGMGTMVRTIGGRIEVGETPVQAACRELREETGLVAGELRLWAAWQPVNKIDWAVYLFIAHRVSATMDASLDAGEKIRLRTYGLDTLLDAPTLPALDDYELLHMLNFARSDTAERERVTKLLQA